jgi:hypothetical protein
MSVNWVDPSFYAYDTRGWTNQNQDPFVASPVGGAPIVPFPANIVLITVTGNYLDFNNTALNGIVYFYPLVPSVTDSALKTIIFAAQTAAPIVNGALSVILPATNDPDFSPSFNYLVTEHVPGGRKNFRITLPYTLPGATVDMSAVTVVSAP